MRSWSFSFLIVTVLAGLLGFTGVADPAAWVAKAFSVVFLTLFLASLFLAGKRAC
jgi:uncharacterized membrane protein YtjA (UPF0391 family)